MSEDIKTPDVPVQNDPLKNPEYLAYVNKSAADKFLAEYSGDPARKMLLDEGGLREVVEANPGLVLNKDSLAIAISMAQTTVLKKATKPQTQSPAPAPVVAQDKPDAISDPLKKPLASATFEELHKALGNPQKALEAKLYLGQRVSQDFGM